MEDKTTMNKILNQLEIYADKLKLSKKEIREARKELNAGKWKVVACGEITNGLICHHGRGTVEGVLICGEHIEDKFQEFAYDDNEYEIAIRIIR